jgi:hypothetical protein
MPLWSLAIGGSGNEEVLGLALDSQDNVYLGGNFDSARIAFENRILDRVSNRDAFVAKLSPGGKVSWASRIGIDGESLAKSVAVFRDESRVWLLGSFTGTKTFDGFPEQATNVKLFLTGFDRDGNPTSLRSVGWCTAGSIDGQAVATDDLKNVYALARYEGNCTWANRSLPSSSLGAPGLVLVKFNQELVVQWIAAFEKANLSSTTPLTMAVDRRSGVLVVGGFRGLLPTATGTLQTRAGGQDGFAIKFDSEGNTRWGIAFGSDGSDAVTAITVDPGNDASLSGWFIGPELHIGDIEVSAHGNATKSFLFTLDEQGGVIAHAVFQASAGMMSQAMDSDGNGIVVGGSFSGTADIGYGPFSAVGSDLFLLRVPKSLRLLRP